MRIIVSGGGTAGHIHPAVATVEALESRLGKENVQVLFVGAEGKMEMSKVPLLGYSIVGLPIVGLQRRFTLKNLTIPGKVLCSLKKAADILDGFKPDVVVGFGGYASLPLLWMAQNKKIKTILWEGNAYAGMANKLLGKRVLKACVSYEGMERFFRRESIRITGNPTRALFRGLDKKNDESLRFFGFTNDRPVVFVTGGSLGARAINDAVLGCIDQLIEEQKIQLIWQTGSYYYRQIQEAIKEKDLRNVWCSDFVDRMDLAYAAADLVVCRAGASTVTELSLARMAALLVPSSNVADNHQFKNADALARLGAAEMLTDDTVVEQLYNVVIQLVDDGDRRSRMMEKIADFAKEDAAKRMVDEILDCVK